MNFYTVRKGDYHLDQDGYDSFQSGPTSMTEAEANHVAMKGGGVVQVWRAELEREYPVSVPALPRLELVG